MPRTGSEPQRRAALVSAAIAEIGTRGTLDVTVSAIARRAGMSSALAHHYFGSKDDMLLLAMRHLLVQLGAEVRRQLKAAETPAQRVDAVIRASFAPVHFSAEAIRAWLNFYVHAAEKPAFARLLRVYNRRLHSTLTHALRPLIGPRAPAAAARLGALIDGLYLRHSLAENAPAPQAAVALLREHLTLEIGTRK